MDDGRFKPGNEFYKLRTTIGPPPKYTPEELKQQIAAYIQKCIDNPLEDEKLLSTPSEVITENEDGSRTIQKLPYTRAIKYKRRPFLMCGLAAHLGITLQSIRNYRKKEAYALVLQEADAIFRTQKIEGTAAGLFNPLIIMSELGMRNHKQVNKTVVTAEMTGAEREKRIADLMAKASKQGNVPLNDDESVDLED